MKPDNTLNQIYGQMYTKNPDIVTRKIAGELFLVPIRGKMADMQQIFTLNTVGEYIWQELDKKKNLNTICDEVVASFDVLKEEAEADVKDFVAELLEAGLITRT